MKIAVVDCSVSGHRETYYKEFVRTWANLGHEVWLIAPQASGTADIATFLPIKSRSLLPLPIGKSIRKKLVVVRNALIRLQNLATLRRQLRGFKPELVYFPCLDDMLPTLAPLALFDLLTPYAWSGLLVQSALPVYKRGMPDVRPFLHSRRCIGIGVLNEYSIDALKPFQKQITCLPDFADLSEPDNTYPLLNLLKERACGRKIISLLGSINARKGVDLLLTAIPLMNVDDYFFFIAGKSSLTETQTEELQTFGENHANCLFVLERIPDEAAFNALVEATDVLFAAYRGFSGSSNLLTKAAAFGKPIIVSQGQCMGKRVTDYRIGIAVPEEDAQACVEAITSLNKQGAPCPEDFARYADRHCRQRLAEELRLLTTNSTPRTI